MIQWVQDRQKPYRLKLKYQPVEDHWHDVNTMLKNVWDWCREHETTFYRDGMYYIRFTNEQDLDRFLMRWS